MSAEGIYVLEGAPPRKLQPVTLPRPLIPFIRPLKVLALPVALFLAWLGTSHWGLMAEQILPHPLLVAATFVELLQSGDLWAHLHISLLRVAQGFAIGASAGILLGTAMGVWRPVDEAVTPVFRAIAQVPSLGWIPLLMLLLGLGEPLKLVIIAKAVMVPITITLADAIRGIPEKYKDVARVCHLRRSTLVTSLLLPAVIPPAFTGVRQGAAHAWVSLVAVEMLAAAEGVGYLMSWGRTLFQLDIVLVGILLVGTVGFLMDWSLCRIERRLSLWRIA